MIQRIILVRKKHRLSQEQFAEKLGLSRNFINQVETGKKNFSGRTINDICRCFHIKEEWLRSGNGSMSDDISSAQAPMQDIFDRFNCSDSEKKFLSAFFGLQESERRAFCDLLVKMFPQFDSSLAASGILDSTLGDEEDYADFARQQRLLEKEQASQTLSAKESDAG